jgi:hypothetical protein
MMPLAVASLALLTVLAYAHPRWSDRRDFDEVMSRRRILRELQRLEMHDPASVIDRIPD